MTAIVKPPVSNSIIRRYPIAVFTLLTFLITHLLNPVIVEIIRILFPGFSFSFPLSGFNEKSLIAQYGSTIAAIFLVIRLYGFNGLKSTLRYNTLNTKTVWWLLISFFMPLVSILFSYKIGGIDLRSLLNLLTEHWQLYLFVIAVFILSAGLAEEYGWRGFLLPQLLKSRSPLTATFIVFVVLSLWHFPALISGWKDEPMLPWLLLSFPVTIIHSWLFFCSKGNLIVVILFHACFDAQYSFFSHVVATTNLEHQPANQGWAFVAFYALIGFVIIAVTKGTLGFDANRFSVTEYFGEKK